MVEKLHSRTFRMLSIGGLLLIAFGFFGFLKIGTAHADASRNTIFFDTTGTHTLTVKTANSSGTISYTVTDYANAQVNSGGPLNVSDGQVNVVLPAQENGYYSLNVTDNTANPARNVRLRYAIIPPFTRPSDSPFGINTHIPGVGSSAALIAAQGGTWARLDVSWSDVEKSPGQYNFDFLDPFMQELAQNNIKPLAILDYENPLYGNGKTPGGNEVDAKFADYVTAVLRHYGSQIQAVEVYNEYNIMNTACGQPNVNCYRALLQAAYQAVKSVDSNVVVVAGATAGNDGGWFEDLFKLGGMQYADAFSYHFYAGPESNNGNYGIEGQTTFLRGLIKKYNDGQEKPVWISEVGYSADSRPEEVQAKYLTRALTLALADGTQRIFWYDLYNDGSDPTEYEQNQGTLRYPDENGYVTPKADYVTYATLTRQLAGLSFVRREPVTSDIYDELFTEDTRVLWTTGDAQQVSLTTNNQLTVTTDIGRTQTYTPDNGVVTLTLTGNAIFVKGNVSAISTSAAGTVFSSGFEPTDTQPTWISTVDESAGISNVRGVCCNLSGPEATIGIGSAYAHRGDHALLYSGYAGSTSGSDYAYTKVFDVGSRNIVIGPSSTLSYWINPESAANSYNYASGSNSTCVGVDLIFSDGSTLRDSGAVDQNGNRAHPFYGQCNHLTLDTWNQVRVNLGSSLNGKTLLRILVGYDQPQTVGGYRGYIDDISITN